MTLIPRVILASAVLLLAPWAFILAWMYLDFVAALLVVFTLFFPIGVYGLANDRSKMLALLVGASLPSLLWVAWAIGPIPSLIAICVALNVAVLGFVIIILMKEA